MTSIAERLHRDLLDSSLVDAANAIKDAHTDAVRTQTNIAVAKGHLDQAQTLGSITPGFPLTNVHLAKFHLEEAAKLMASYTARVHPEKNAPVIDLPALPFPPEEISPSPQPENTGSVDVPSSCEEGRGEGEAISNLKSEI